MSDLLAARAQMGTSLAFHIIFSALGVGLPLLFCIAEGLALKTKNRDWMLLTRRWSKGAAILFAIGAVSGTILSFELGLLWPTFMDFGGGVIGYPFMLEGFAFFLEAIFLGLYLYGWNRLSPRAHWLCSFPVWISALVSAWFVVSANAWMNTPTGFVLKNGRPVDIDPIQAMLNPSTPYETIHMMLACYVATGFAVAAVYAWGILRGKRDNYHRKGLMIGMLMAVIATPLQIISGDFNARFLSDAQPTKFAAMEAVFHSGNGLPITIGGLVDPDNRTVHYGIELPKLLSVLAKGDPNAPLKGLDQFAPSDWPNIPLVHLSFDVMVGCGFFGLLVAAVFWISTAIKRRIPLNRVLLWGVVIAGPLAFLAIETGWMVTELGRQPWTIVGFLRTADAATPAPWVTISFLVFSLVYILLAVALIGLLLWVARSPMPQVGMPGQEQPVEKAGV
ncbi:cytochrome d ubiquinol oxidase subunit I [Thermosporothrix hazakensis]|jgi:cytochrome d ubiquinol oxidase subunit I|uniref:Cytochrome d ubiquinol oxidase subunit I n=2 Tax=Thermosporothrix TaxID=768650 RepID=A0A326UDN5_THEHA|nr:cytochrome ubiquinol oxidase subunit I [Thermosporothrix hazakensis]PZW36396.1 cytochrome d ubiquinol oxidase subunit I [Thermosporothrix hazakensis]BBH88861.1 cytochrome ubiquinol oxidase subunit I [Thermosporothrix sp. COM3]GCE47046.1 cytochrome ubiquinol oxidase subunit I [Thermosporothrix hazakensis]